MKPLTIVTIYNRLDVTKRMLASLKPSLDALETVIVDNGSNREAVEWLCDWCKNKRAIYLITLPKNIGCPRALNIAIDICRKPEQAVIKLDNDIIMPNSTVWLSGIQRMIKYLKRRFHVDVAMVGAYYNEWNMSRVRDYWNYESKTIYNVSPVIGHAVYHTGAFMDAVGYFDVVHPAHLYGFEDNIMSLKAAILKQLGVAWKGWTIENTQRHSALGRREAVDQHVKDMRPYYNARVSALRAGGSIYTGQHGKPEERRA